MQGMQLQVGRYVHDYFTLQIHSFKRFCFLLLRWVMLHCGDATAMHIPLPGFKQFDFFNMTHSYCIISFPKSIQTAQFRALISAWYNLRTPTAALDFKILLVLYRQKQFSKSSG